MKKIAIDMDGVLANIFEQFVQYDEAETGIRKNAAFAVGKAELEPFPNAMKHLHTPGFFRNAGLIEGSRQVLELLNEYYNVFIVSAATEFPQSLSEKQAWLNEHFPFITCEQMVFCGSKKIIRADIMIDDHFKNLDHFDGQTILFTQPHNQLADPGRHTRVHSWNQVEELLLQKHQLFNTGQLKKSA